jgi:hypothetical protein
MDVDLQVDAVVSALAWPVVVLAVALLWKDKLIDLLKAGIPRLKSISFGGISLGLADVATGPVLAEGAAVDLSHAGSPGDVNDSTLRTFYTQILEPSRLESAVVDLGEGAEWLTSRLFVLTVILSRMRGVHAVVFVETAGHVRRRLVGTCDSDVLRWRLGARFPWLEAALAMAENEMWVGVPPPPPPPLPTGVDPPVRVADDEGRIASRFGPSADPMAQLLRSFLREIQVVLPPSSNPPSAEWQRLFSEPDPSLLFEKASWRS